MYNLCIIVSRKRNKNSQSITINNTKPQGIKILDVLCDADEVQDN